MHATIDISDADRCVDYTLEVLFDFRPSTSGDRVTPGEAVRVEVASVRCPEVTIWCGKHGVGAEAVSDAQEKSIGSWCLEKYREEIESELLKQCGVET